MFAVSHHPSLPLFHQTNHRYDEGSTSSSAALSSAVRRCSDSFPGGVNLSAHGVLAVRGVDGGLQVRPAASCLPTRDIILNCPQYLRGHVRGV